MVESVAHARPLGPAGRERARTAKKFFSGFRKSLSSGCRVDVRGLPKPAAPVVASCRRWRISHLLDLFRSRGSKPQVCRLEETTGFMTFHDHQLFYKIFHPPGPKEGHKTPVLVLHGGPQLPHNYLESVGQLAFLGHPVVMFDQSGCGMSGAPFNSEVFSIEYLRDQVAFVMDELSLTEVHLMGHSAGGILALEFVRAYPESVASLALCSTPSHVGVFLQELSALTRQLPLDVQRALNGALDQSQDAYQRAIDVVNKNFLCRLKTWPEPLLKSIEMAGTTFRGVGAISSWQVCQGDLAKINVPVLHLSGRYDEVTPNCIAPLHSSIPNSEWTIFEESSHMPFLEEPAKFINAMANFLGRAESDNPTCHLYC